MVEPAPTVGPVEISAAPSAARVMRSATVNSDAAGSISNTGTVGSDPPGDDSDPTNDTSTVVTPPGSTSPTSGETITNQLPTLAVTGTDIGLLMLVGGLMLAAGGTMMIGTRRRRT